MIENPRLHLLDVRSVDFMVIVVFTLQCAVVLQVMGWILHKLIENYGPIPIRVK